MKILILKLLKVLLSIKNSRKLYSLLSKIILSDTEIRHVLPSIIYSKEGSRVTPELINLVAESSKLASVTILDCCKIIYRIVNI